MNMPTEEALPADFPNRENIIKFFPTVDKLAANWQEAQKTIDSTIRAPAKDDDTEAWAKFYRRIGAPETPDGYQIPTGSENFQNLVKSLRDPAAAAGVTTKQWDSLMAKAKEAVEADMQKIAEATAAWSQQSKEKYGDDFADKRALVETTLKEIVGEDKVADAMRATGLLDNPHIMEAMLAVNEARKDDNVPSGTGGGDTPPDYMGMAAEVRQMVKEGVLSDVRHPDFEKSMGKFIAISQVLNEAGFDGPDDQRLMPQWMPKPPIS